MRFLVLSDIHGNTENIEKLDAEFKKADAVLMAGDFARFKAPETALPILQLLAKKHQTIYAVTGNCDEPSFIEELEKYDTNVQGTMVYSEGLFFAGSGGALKFTGVTPNERSDEELMQDLQIVCDRSSEYEDPDSEDETEVDSEFGPESAKKTAPTDSPSEGLEPSAQNNAGESDWSNLVLLVHQPPHKTKLDKISAGMHVGSALFRVFIEEYKPLLAISGHIHESAAIDSIGDTVLMNPGSLAEGQYGIVEVVKNKGDAARMWKVGLAELKTV